MTARAIDPNNGWVFEDGRWVWEGGATTGHIEDGTVQGQVTTWDVAKTEWTPENNVTVDGDVINVERATVGKVMNDAGTAVGAGLLNNVSGSAVLVGNNGNTFIPNIDDQISLGNSDNRFKDATFSGTVDAAGFTVNGQPISGGGGGGSPLNVDAGNGTGIIYFGGQSQNKYIWYNGTRFELSADVFATDFIASSDERLKDNITTAPVGLIDSLKGREWDWSESGEKGSGVVAQELEQVLPHLVHEDEDGMKSVSYNGLVAYLIEEIKDLKAQVEALK